MKLETLVKKQTLNSDFLPKIGANQTLLTEKKTASGPATFRADRPVLIISSTSWTADEDFQILLDAAKQYDDLAKLENGNKAGSIYRKLLFVITGKGPQKQHYEEVISKMALENVAFITTWLSAEDYPLLLGMYYAQWRYSAVFLLFLFIVRTRLLVSDVLPVCDQVC